MRTHTTIIFALAACGGGTLEELPRPQTCEHVYDVTSTQEVPITIEVGDAFASSFTPLGDTLEIAPLPVGTGEWGSAIDVRLTPTDGTQLPQTACGEIAEAPNNKGGPLEQRGNRFERQTDGTLLARDVLITLPHRPQPGTPFAGVVVDNAGIFVTLDLTYPGHYISEQYFQSIVIVNDVGFLGTSSNGGGSGSQTMPDASLPPPQFSSCTSTTSTPPRCAEFELQPQSGMPPANALDPWFDVLCEPFAAPVQQGTLCEGGYNGVSVQAQCTIVQPQTWGQLGVKYVFYGPVANPTAEESACVANGGFWSAI